MAVEDKVKGILKEVLDLLPSEIKPDETLDQAYGVDSTEMVEITVGLKKELGLDMENSDLKKTMTYNEIVGILKGKM